MEVAEMHILNKVQWQLFASMSFKSERLPECVRLPQLERSAAYNSAVDLDVYAIYLLGAVEPRTFRRGGKLH